MIIAQYSALNASSIAPSGAAQIFQVSANGTTAGLAAGNVVLNVGEGFLFGLPFVIRMSGVATVVTTAFTLAPGLVISGPAGATPAATAKNAGASGSLAAGSSYSWFTDFVLSIDGVSQALQGYTVNQAGGSAIAGPTAMSALTGFTLFPSNVSTSTNAYSWPSPITGLDTKINNGVIMQLNPQITASASSAGSTVTLLQMVVMQG
jgi:hypothetical protein